MSKYLGLLLALLLLLLLSLALFLSLRSCWLLFGSLLGILAYRNMYMSLNLDFSIQFTAIGDCDLAVVSPVCIPDRCVVDESGISTI